MSPAIERLYGVDHGGTYTNEGVAYGEFIVHPSKELLQTLRDLPEGTKVGLEYHPDHIELQTVNGNTFIVDSSTMWYWKEVLDACIGKDIVFLEDPELYRLTMQKVNEVMDAGNALKAYSAERRGDPLRKSELRRAYYVAQVEQSYAYEVLREEAMLRIIQEEEPSVVIIGQAHADYFIHAAEEIQEGYGITIGSYIKEAARRNESTFLPIFIRFEPQESHGYLHSNTIPDKDTLLRREMIVKRYLEIHEGEIVP